jgi:elongation factor 3
MMAPAATSPEATGKTGDFDLATVFVADKAARDEAALALTNAAKKEGVEFFASIQFNDAVVKVSYKHLRHLCKFFS